MEVPSEGTVFEHFFNLSEGMMGDTSNPINCSRSKSPQMVYTTVPQVSPPIFQLSKCVVLLILLYLEVGTKIIL